MKQYIYSLIAILGLGLNAYSQDVITPKLGQDILATDVEVSTVEVTYRAFEDKEGPRLSIPRKDVLIISYEDGTKEVLFKQKKVIKNTDINDVNDSLGMEIKDEGPGIITLQSGEEIKAKVVQVNETEIVYQLENSTDDSTFSIPKSDALIVNYANGSKKLLYKQPKVSSEVDEKRKTDLVQKVKQSKVTFELAERGRQDAYLNYNGRRSGAVWTAVTSIVLTPVAGLIPAVACSVATPKEKNLEYPDQELKKEPEYSKAYIKKARRIKAGKVITGYLLGTATWLVIIFF